MVKLQHEVKFGPNAALELVMSGLEAFQAKDLAKKKSSVETLGHLWGYRRTRDDTLIHVVEHVSVSVLAERRSASVSNEPEIARLKSAVVEYMRPELCFLGDFHTHPYGSLTEVQTNKGWQYSDMDDNCLMSDNVTWRLSNHSPLMIVLAICPMQRVHIAEPFHQQANVFCFDIAQYRMWLAAYVGMSDDDGRCITPRTRANVGIAPLTSELWHLAGERLTDYFDTEEQSI